MSPPNQQSKHLRRESIFALVLFAIAGTVIIASSFAAQDPVSVDISGELAQSDTSAFNGEFIEFNQATQRPPTKDDFKPDSLEDWGFLPQRTYRATNQTRYVSPNGANSGDGTNIEAPISLNRAVDLATAGDVIYLLEGTYNQQLNIVDTDGEPDKPIVFAAEPGKPRSAVISHGESHIGRVLRSDHIVVDSLVFDGENSSTWGIATGRRYSGDPQAGASTNVSFIGNEIRNVGKENALNISLVDTALISNNYIHDAGPPTLDRGEGIYIGCGACPVAENTSRNVIIEGNKIQDVGAEGIEQKAGTRDVIIRDNLILDSGWNQTYNEGGTCCFGAGIVVHLISSRPNFDSNSLIERNRAGRLSYHGILVGAGNTIARDNLVWESGVEHHKGYGAAGSVIPRTPYATNLSFFDVFNSVSFINNHAANIGSVGPYDDRGTYGQPAQQTPNVLAQEIDVADSLDAAFNAWLSSSFD